ncbi:MAG: sigma-70 family RNA polymerase sigma factor [Candidatus Eisenbacteria bacterium]|uniref:Sigma-70 family RNA polymerase sigma factor n=1 Tax=Eiseniibacteriota bacterium TaxID=2212470 RepID=A0A933SBA3_UNCEI|nr:sigma-70 family RNA polymerase sigma factor [Candidatus Eisenbacteria bacterium]
MAEYHDPSLEGFDWAEIRTTVRRRLSFHLRGWESADIEDATQDVLLSLVRFLERSGAPVSMEGLIAVVARRTAVSRMRLRARRPATQPVEEEHVVAPDDGARRELLALEEAIERKALAIREYFRLHQAPCLELAEARANGVDFKQLAGTTGQSHVALLQRWSRCMKRLREAIGRGDVPWDRSGGDA